MPKRGSEKYLTNVCPEATGDDFDESEQPDTGFKKANNDSIKKRNIIVPKSRKSGPLGASSSGQTTPTAVSPNRPTYSFSFNSNNMNNPSTPAFSFASSAFGTNSSTQKTSQDQAASAPTASGVAAAPPGTNVAPAAFSFASFGSKSQAGASSDTQPAMTFKIPAFGYASAIAPATTAASGDKSDSGTKIASADSPKASPFSFSAGSPTLKIPFASGAPMSFSAPSAPAKTVPASSAPAAALTSIDLSSPAKQPENQKSADRNQIDPTAAARLEEFGKHLRGLNESFLKFVRSLADKDCFEDLSIVFKSYQTQRQSIIEEFSDVQDLFSNASHDLQTDKKRPEQIAGPVTPLVSAPVSAPKPAPEATKSTPSPPVPPPGASGIQPFPSFPGSPSKALFGNTTSSSGPASKPEFAEKSKDASQESVSSSQPLTSTKSFSFSAVPPSASAQSKPPPFSFGPPPTSANDTSSVPGLQRSTTAPSGFGFSFGSNPATPAVGTSSSTPLFGQMAVPGSSATSGFSFGSKTQPFTFGSAAANTPPVTNNQDPTSSDAHPNDANKENDEEGEEMPQEEQVGNTLMVGAGEEGEELVYETRAKVFVSDEANSWKPLGVGPLKIKKNTQTGKHRILMRADSIGHVLLNAAIFKTMPTVRSGPNQVLIMTAVDGEKLEKRLLKLKDKDIAQALLDELEKVKNDLP